MVALSKTGDVYTFGVNNKGQCGRDFPSSKEGAATASNVASAFNQIGSSCSAMVEGAEAVDDTNSDADLDQDGKCREPNTMRGFSDQFIVFYFLRSWHFVRSGHPYMEAQSVHDLFSVWRMHRIWVQLRISGEARAQLGQRLRLRRRRLGL